MIERHNDQMLGELQNQEIIARSERRSMIAITALCALADAATIPTAIESDAPTWLITVFAAACVLGSKFALSEVQKANADLQEIRRQIQEYIFLERLNNRHDRTAA